MRFPPGLPPGAPPGAPPSLPPLLPPITTAEFLKVLIKAQHVHTAEYRSLQAWLFTMLVLMIALLCGIAFLLVALVEGSCVLRWPSRKQKVTSQEV